MKLIFALILLCFTFSSFGEVTSKGDLTIESRVFTDDDNDTTIDENYGLASRLQATHSHGDFEEKFSIFSRVDRKDSSRSIFIIEELHWSYYKDAWSITIGHQILNWSATEAFHPADAINSRNYDSNIENAEKFGEPMVNLKWEASFGTLSFYFFPYTQNVNLPADSNRLGFQSSQGLVVNEPIWVDADGERVDDNFIPQYGAKFDFTVKSADISLYALNMNDRFIFGRLVDTFFGSPTGATLLYLPLRQYGFTVQAVMDAWVFKIETAYKDFINPDLKFSYTPSIYDEIEKEDHSQIAWGIEYGWAHKDGKESTVILEGQQIFGVEDDIAATYNIFQNDVLLGYRFAFNDINSKELFFSVITDLERKNENLFSASYQQRLTDVWTIKSGLRYIHAPKKGLTASNLENLHKANQFYLNLVRYF